MTGMEILRSNWLLAGVVALPVCAFAQGSNYDVQTMNFDMWCQEQAHLAPERCDKRTPEDEETFEAYRGKIEQYEIPYLEQKKKQITLENNVLRKDPVDNPITQTLPNQSSQQQRNPSTDPHTPQP
jgi:hypothetical protein